MAAWRVFLFSLGFYCLLALPLTMLSRPYIFCRIPLAIIAGVATPSSATPVAVAARHAEASDQSVQEGAASPRGGSPWPQIVLAIWGTGLAAVGGKLCAGLRAAWRLRRRARTESEPHLRIIAAEIGNALQLRRPVSIMISEEIHSPAAVLFWYNPLVWAALRRLRAEQEMACDDLVLANGIKTTDYAGHLLHILRVQRQAGSPTPAAMTGGVSIIERRIRRMLMPGRTFTSPRKGSFRLALLMAAAGLALLCRIGIGAAAQPTPPAETKPAFTDSFTLWPLADGFRITSLFGGRLNPKTGKMMWHSGIDLAVKTGTPVRVVAGGTVIQAGWKVAYGYCVTVNRGDNLATLYAKLSSVGVTLGQEVGVGEAIALSGSTGIATGPHLHFEVHKGDQAVDPLVQLP